MALGRVHMDVTPENGERGESFLNRKTLIMGDVNRGKTRRTLAIVESLCRRNLAAQMVLLDLAPETITGIGGKMAVPHPDILVLSPVIHPPRLTGRDSAHVLRLARINAETIEPLLERALASARTILVVNDASLYLQAGVLEKFLTVLNAFPTAVINAYAGRSFAPAPFTEIERDAVLALARACDQVIEV